MLTSIHLSYILGSLPFAKRFPAARKLGFNGVEYPFPYDTPAATYASLLKDNDLQQITLGAPTSNYRAAEPGYSVTPRLRDAFVRSIDTAIAYAKEINCRRVHVFAGPLAPEVSKELAWDTYCTNLADAYDRLAKEGIEAVVEPINSHDFAGYFLNSLAMAKTTIEVMSGRQVKIVLDVYHAHVNQENPVEFLRQNSELVTHIQLADFPGRHEPGTGRIDFEELYGSIIETGYSGSLGLEYVPLTSVFDELPLREMLAGWRARGSGL